MIRIKSLSLLFFLILLAISCQKNDQDEFAVAEPVDYYLRNEDKLNQNSGTSDEWIYISKYIYPGSQVNSISWDVYLEKNIVKGYVGCDLIFYTDSDCEVRLDFILKDGSDETIFITQNVEIPHINETTAFEYERDPAESPLEGSNPMAGRNQYLILRITHISGSDPVQVLFDAAPGFMGCSFITVFHDK
ncbi:MAG: hypothetical protein K9J25_09430 [Bacteroidales bacterium]|nr:hypothetical protein [Bacteroidales bacterium]